FAKCGDHPDAQAIPGRKSFPVESETSPSREGCREAKESRLNDAIHPVPAPDRIGYTLERTREPPFRVKAFRNAAGAIRGLSDDELRELAASGRLRDLPGVGEKTERVIVQALAGERRAERL